MPAVTTVSEMHLAGGAPCFDFVNSGIDTEKNVIIERLHTYQDLLVLADRCGLLTPHELKELRKLATAGKKEPEKVLQSARKARTALFEIFTAIAHQRLHVLPQQTLDVFNDFYNSMQQSQAFVIRERKVQLSWRNYSAGLWRPLHAFLLSAAEVLRNKEQSFIKQCKGCEWLFIDETKNHRRKWCEMETCGSSAKAKRYYLRKRGDLKEKKS